MTMLADVKTALRVTTDDLDSDITILINAAVDDLKLVGVTGSTVDTASTDPLVQRAIITFCRANFGQPDDYEKMKVSYDEQKAQLWMATDYTDWGDGV